MNAICDFRKGMETFIIPFTEARPRSTGYSITRDAINAALFKTSMTIREESVRSILNDIERNMAGDT